MNQYSLEQNSEYSFFQIKPTPTSEEIAKYYAQEFYSGDYPKLNDSSLEVQLEDKEFYDSHREDMCESIQTILGKRLEGLTILDIGCGWGQALLYFKSKGMDCYGFDPAPEAVAYGQKRGLNNLVLAGLDTMNVFKKRFDVVTLLNVLEHLGDPVKVIDEIKQHVLRPGGLLIIDVPNEFNPFQTAGQKLHDLKEWWVCPPGHLNYFSKDTLCKLLEAKGFEIKLTESSFPLEMFLLFGRNYVKDPALGKQSHKERVNFELNLRKYAGAPVLRKFYRMLAELNLGRQILVFAVNE